MAKRLFAASIMSQRDIPGRLDMRALQALHGNATLHKPTTRPEFMREAVRLVGTGLLPGDIARALGLTRNAVVDLLAGRT